MQSEVRIYCIASLAVFGADDVPSSAGSSQWILHLAEEPAEQASQRGHATDRSAPEIVGRERQGLRLSQAARRPSRSGRDMLPEPGCASDTHCRDQGADRLQTPSGIYGGRPSVIVDNALDRQFDVEAQDTAWVTDITSIQTCEGFAYLAVVIYLYSRRVIGWAMQSHQTTDVVLQAPLMAVWQRKPKDRC